MIFPIELRYESVLEKREYLKPDSHQKYAEIDPYAIYGAVSASAPMLNHCPGNRAIHESAMSISSLTEISSNFKNMSETSAKVLHRPHVPVITTKYAAYGNNILQTGKNMPIAIKIDEGNVEDSFLVSEREAKMSTDGKISTYEIIVDTEDIPGISLHGNMKIGKYRHVDSDTGLPLIGSELDVGDVIFAKYKKEIISQVDDDGNKKEEEQLINKSVFIEEGKEGEVQNIKRIPNDKFLIYRITVSKTRNMVVGRKLSFDGCSQKGIIGQILPHNQMPIIISGKNKGMRPSAIFSPMSTTSRATPSVNHSLLLGNYAIASGNQVDGTSFTINNDKINDINNKLMDMGFENWGYEEFEDPVSKSRFKLAFGFAYIKILKHTSDDKQKACGHIDHTIDKGSRQPSKGGPLGALRVGYMDTNTMGSHNIMATIQAFLAEQSDLITVAICSDCGHLCDRHNDDAKTIKDNYASKHCTRCEKSGVIVKCKVPYAVVKIHNWSLTVGIKLNLFPKISKK